MEYKIIDAHAHLWLKQDTEINGQKIKTLDNGKSIFMGEVRQMLPPFITDGRNTAEVFLSNMDYAQVSAAVITQATKYLFMGSTEKIPEPFSLLWHV